MAIIVVPTYYVVYKVLDERNGELAFVKEYKTKGDALKWINKDGERGINYLVREYFRK